VDWSQYGLSKYSLQQRQSGCDSHAQTVLRHSNPISPALSRSYIQPRRSRSESEVRAIILTGAGRAFLGWL